MIMQDQFRNAYKIQQFYDKKVIESFFVLSIFTHLLPFDSICGLVKVPHD